MFQYRDNGAAKGIRHELDVHFTGQAPNVVCDIESRYLFNALNARLVSVSILICKLNLLSHNLKTNNIKINTQCPNCRLYLFQTTDDRARRSALNWCICCDEVLIMIVSIHLSLNRCVLRLKKRTFIAFKLCAFLI